MRLFLRLAWRNVWRHRRRTLIIVLAISLTTALLMMYDGMMVGFDQAIYGNAVKVMGGNVQVHAEGYEARPEAYPLLPLADAEQVVTLAEQHPQVAAATRRITTGGMVTNREGAFAVSIVGIEPERERPVGLVLQNVREGAPISAGDGDLLLIGKGLASAMEVGVGDRITLAGLDVHKQMRQRTMTIAGIYDLGMADLEKQTVYMSLAEAQTLYMASGQSSEVVLWHEHLGHEEAVIASLSPSLPGYEIMSWRNSFPELVNTLATKGAVMDVFGLIMLLIASIGMLNLLLMAVYERTREIGLLGALGVKPRQISLMFILEGALTGLVGAVAGVILGLALNATIGQIGFDFTPYADMTTWTALLSDRIYSALSLESAPKYLIMATAVSTLAAFYTARQAASREPAIALHHV